MSVFDAAQRSPRYAEWMSFTPDTSSTGYVVLLAFLAVFTGVCGCMSVLFILGGPMALIPMAMAAAGAFAFFSVLARKRKFEAAPLERVVVLIREENTEVSVSHTHQHTRNGSHREARVRQDHFVLLELENGDRQSHQVDAELAHAVTKGDVGIAYLKGGVMLDFKVLPLSE